MRTLALTFVLICSLPSALAHRPEPWIPCFRWILNDLHELPELIGEMNDTQLEVLGTLIHALEAKNQILFHHNAYDLLGMPYSKVVGRAQYRKDGASGHLRVFDSPHHFWIAFDWVVQQRLLFWESVGETGKPSSDMNFAIQALKEFDLFQVEFRRDYENGVYPAIFLEYLRQKREARLPGLIHGAVEKFEKGGHLVNWENAETITGLKFDVLMGVDFYNPSAPHSSAHKRGMEGGISHFWTLFNAECKRRAREMERNQSNWNRFTPANVRRLKNFSIFRVTFKAKDETTGKFPPAILALFDEHRVKEQNYAIENLVKALADTGKIVKANTARPDFGIDWYQLMGRQNYSNRRWGYHRRIFDAPEHFWIEFDRAVRAEIRKNQKLIADRKGNYAINASRLRNLESFSIDQVRFDSPVEQRFEAPLRSIYRRHKVEPTFVTAAS